MRADSVPGANQHPALRAGTVVDDDGVGRSRCPGRCRVRVPRRVRRRGEGARWMWRVKSLQHLLLTGSQPFMDKDHLWSILKALSAREALGAPPGTRTPNPLIKRPRA